MNYLGTKDIRMIHKQLVVLIIIIHHVRHQSQTMASIEYSPHPKNQKVIYIRQ